MTHDQRTRAAQRQGDRVAWLTERLRRGDRAPWACHICGGVPDRNDLMPGLQPCCQGTGRAPFRSAVELAAYCGDPAARALVDKDLAFVDQVDLSTFVKGLRSLTDPSKWSGAIERAALAACEVIPCMGCLAGVLGTHDVCGALQAARAHIEAPSEETREICAWRGSTQGPARLLCYYLGFDPGSWDVDESSQLAHVVNAAARLSDPAAVRAGICAALIEWALA